MAVATGLDALLAAKEIVVCCGSGGVGKTTVAAAIGLGAATRQGGRVLVLTVDPARRLATALGVGALGNLETQVPPQVLEAACGTPPRGELWAAMLDTKQGWDQLVLRHAPDELTAFRILDNRLYANLTSRFVQSHDYIAMERLYELHSSGDWDLIVIDTPPSRHAIDFLDAPARMAEFFGGRFLRLLTLPYRVAGQRGSRMINAASRPFYSIADRLLGTRFLQQIAEFFLNFQSMYDGFVQRAEAVERLLRDRVTTFAVVTTLEAAPIDEAEDFIAALRDRRLHLGAVVLNRVLPDYLRAPGATDTANRFVVDADVLGAALASGAGAPAALSDASRNARVLRTIGESFGNFALVAAREAELRRELHGVPDVVVTVPSAEGEISDIAGLAWIARHVLS